jgi:hypothetical protein
MLLKNYFLLLVASIFFFTCGKNEVSPTLRSVSMVKITMPLDSSETDFNNEILFVGKVDSLPDYSTLRVEWSSDKDGVLNKDLPQNGGILNFKKSLSQGIHRIKLRVILPNNSVNSDSIIVFNTLKPVKLYTPKPTTECVSLVWSRSMAGSNFREYRIYRLKDIVGTERGTLIKTVKNNQDTSFQDCTVLLGDAYRYTIVVADRFDKTADSNFENVTPGIYVHLPISAKKMVFNPKHQLLFAILQQSKGLAIIDVPTKKLLKIVLENHFLTDANFAPNGDLLYIGEADESGLGGRDSIHVFNMVTKQMSNGFKIREYPDLIRFGASKMYIKNFYFSNVHGINEYDPTTCTPKQFMSSVANGSAFDVSPDGKWFAVNGNYSGRVFIYLNDIAADGTLGIGKYVGNGGQYRDYRTMKFTRNGQRILADYVVFDMPTRRVIREFDEDHPILCINPEGKLIVTSQKELYEPDTQNVLRTLPFAGTLLEWGNTQQVFFAAETYGNIYFFDF